MEAGRLGDDSANPDAVKTADIGGFTNEDRQALAYQLYYERLRLADVAAGIRDMTGTKRYNKHHAAYDIWRCAQDKQAAWLQEQLGAFGNFDVVGTSMATEEKTGRAEPGIREFYFRAIERAVLDLQNGMPCTRFRGFRVLYPNSNLCGPISAVDGDREYHCCAPDAFAWLTSENFMYICQSLDWPWREVMGAVMHIAQVVATAYPWLGLIPASVCRLACLLDAEPEASPETLLYCHSLGDSWESILHAYGGPDIPTEASMGLAARMIHHTENFELSPPVRFRG